MKISAIIKSVILFSFLSFSWVGLGQNKSDKKEKIEQLKIAFITTELSLSEADAKSFWPVYDEMTSKIRTEKKIQRKTRTELNSNAESYSESEFKSKSERLFNSEIKEIQLKKDYHSKIAGIIGYKKATKLLSLEQRFKRELLNKLNEGKRSEGKRPSGPRQR